MTFAVRIPSAKRLKILANCSLAMVGALVLADAAVASPATYKIDPEHTYPSIAIDHMGGLSTWRGKFNKTSGTLVIDKDAGTGTVDIAIETASIDFGNDRLNAHAASPDMLGAAKYPVATYKGKLIGFKTGGPARVEGLLTLHGVTKPVTLQVKSFVCKKQPMVGREACGADAYGSFDRSDFGVAYGKMMGFDTKVELAIQVEALIVEAAK